MLGESALWGSKVRKMEESERRKGSGRDERGEIGQLGRPQLWLLLLKLSYLLQYLR